MVDTKLDERIARIEKELAAIKAKVEAERQEESRPKYRLRIGGFPYRYKSGDNPFYPDLPYQIEMKTVPIGLPTIAAFREKETANRVCAFLNQEKVREPLIWAGKTTVDGTDYRELRMEPHDWEQFKAALRARGVID